jgi:hypothetical protein
VINIGEGKEACLDEIDEIPAKIGGRMYCIFA